MVAANTTGEQATEGASTSQPVAPPAAAVQERLLVGDKLNISFFEQLNLGKAVDIGVDGDVRTFYQRLDLTGDRTVDAEGSIAIPLVGRFTIAGMTADEAQGKIMEAYQQVTGRAAEVHIAVLGRQPVFVTGLVRNPGAYQFQPGMILAQAVALAGGYDKDLEGSARFIELRRELERHTQAVDRLERLMAKRVRLIQESASSDDPTKFNAQIEDSSEPDELSGAVDGEALFLNVSVAAHAGELKLQDERVASEQNKLSALETMSELVDSQIEVRSERLRALQAMQGRGLATLEPLWNAQKDVADFELQRKRLTVEIQAAKQNVAEAMAIHSKLITDQKVATQRELLAVDDEIAQQKAIANTSEEITAALETDMMQVERGTAELRLLILRRTGSSTVALPGDEVTDLMPGDVVKVEVTPSGRSAHATATGSL